MYLVADRRRSVQSLVQNAIENMGYLVVSRKNEQGLESGYVTTLAHAYVIIDSALNVTLHFCIDRNCCLL